MLACVCLAIAKNFHKKTFQLKGTTGETQPGPQFRLSCAGFCLLSYFGAIKRAPYSISSAIFYPKGIEMVLLEAVNDWDPNLDIKVTNCPRMKFEAINVNVLVLFMQNFLA